MAQKKTVACSVWCRRAQQICVLLLYYVAASRRAVRRLLHRARLFDAGVGRRARRREHRTTAPHNRVPRRADRDDARFDERLRLDQTNCAVARERPEEHAAIHNASPVQHLPSERVARYVKKKKKTSKTNTVALSFSYTC